MENPKDTKSGKLSHAQNDVKVTFIHCIKQYCLLLYYYFGLKRTALICGYTKQMRNKVGKLLLWQNES